ncbi:MAG: zinc ribbon domain-containing protein [Candidatus Aminicenantes bacterium]|nr:zinc ribbon domain-containing protein [Candidatus Aminicenantes bacterium]
MAIKRCPYCKAIIDEGTEYCSNCGTRLLFPEDEKIEEPIPGEKLTHEGEEKKDEKEPAAASSESEEESEEEGGEEAEEEPLSPSEEIKEESEELPEKIPEVDTAKEKLVDKMMRERMKTTPSPKEGPAKSPPSGGREDYEEKEKEDIEQFIRSIRKDRGLKTGDTKDKDEDMPAWAKMIEEDSSPTPPPGEIPPLDLEEEEEKEPEPEMSEEQVPKDEMPTPIPAPPSDVDFGEREKEKTLKEEDFSAQKPEEKEIPERYEEEGKEKFEIPLVEEEVVEDEVPSDEEEISIEPEEPPPPPDEPSESIPPAEEEAPEEAPSSSRSWDKKYFEEEKPSTHEDSGIKDVPEEPTKSPIDLKKAFRQEVESILSQRKKPEEPSLFEREEEKPPAVEAPLFFPERRPEPEPPKIEEKEIRAHPSFFAALGARFFDLLFVALFSFLCFLVASQILDVSIIHFISTNALFIGLVFLLFLGSYFFLFFFFLGETLGDHVFRRPAEEE